MSLYLKYLKIQTKTAIQYRTSLIFTMFATTLSTIAVYFGILALFSKYTTIGGYSINEVLITYSIVVCGFSLSEGIFRGFDQFDKLVKTGELDRLLIRPRSLFVQLLGQKIEFSKFGRSIFCGIIMIYALTTSGIIWTVMKVITVILMMLGTIIVFFSMFLIFDSLSIFTVEGLEAINIITNGGRDLCYYPLDVYSNFFKKAFTFIVPLGTVNYLPLKYLLGQSSLLLYALSPLFTLIFFTVSLLLFKWSLTKYKSTGN